MAGGGGAKWLVSARKRRGIKKKKPDKTRGLKADKQVTTAAVA